METGVIWGRNYLKKWMILELPADVCRCGRGEKRQRQYMDCGQCIAADTNKKLGEANYKNKPSDPWKDTEQRSRQRKPNKVEQIRFSQRSPIQMPSGGKPCPSGSQYSKQEKETCEEGNDLVKVVWFAEAVERLHRSPRGLVTDRGGGTRRGVYIEVRHSRDHLHEDFTIGVIISANLAAPFTTKWPLSAKSSS